MLINSHVIKEYDAINMAEMFTVDLNIVASGKDVLSLAYIGAMR